MRLHIFSNDKKALASALLLSLLLSSHTTGAAFSRQDANKATTTPPAQNQLTPAADAAGEEKAEQILRRAVEALGGNSFLGVQTLVSRGFYTQFRDGVSATPATFTDYLAFPDRERTEFKGQGVKSIQTYMGDAGWLYDGATRAIKDIKPGTAKDFQLSMRTSIDNVLRGWWRKEGARLSYAGRREAGLGKRNEVVRLTYTDGFTVEFEFGAKDNLPYKARYTRQNAEGEQVEEEDRYARHLTLSGVTLPFVIDHFRAGMQTSRISYDTIEFNRPLPDSLFARPADVKALK